ncbi:26859_t:CDS:2 [Gigaspora margarita]|uniref:26859_t:CDS:1 n=1 Tax=Gigaspora margarita TaxID=4874 RepID=A0ABN7VWW4_GIGMA|nr:26859_t:CDS:2 [Gigaspora margarita]
MSTSNEATNVAIVSRTETCTHCGKLKPIAEFTRMNGSRMAVNASCNACSDRDKRYQANKKAKSINENIQSLPLNENNSVDVDSIENSSNDLLYNIHDIEELINIKFGDSKEKDEPVKFSVIVKLKRELVHERIMSPEADQHEDAEFHKVINTLLLPLQAGSGYYWELRCATAHLECTQRIDRQHKCQDDQPIKRVREVPTIERYPCDGNIVVKIDLCEQEAKINFKHLIAHEHPTYREINLPKNALYITDVENQLKSLMNFIEQSELINTGYKVICYQDNDFVRSLGFVTPFLRIIKNNNISEIVIDSIFKTNQEKFELFAVNINCGGYGVPLAYLYLDTYIVSEEQHLNLNNIVHSRVGALTEFFISLYNEGVLLAFVLLDKDSREINAVQKAWPKSIIQLCLWHVKHAIERKLKEKKIKKSQYTIQKAQEAYLEFDFINPNWLPVEQQDKICPEEFISELLGIVKKHALMHPLITMKQNLFLIKEKIRSQCDWNLFAWAAYPKAIPIAKTTMITESHWRVLKYNYKYNCNRPRLDRLTQILTKELNEWKSDIEKNISTTDNYHTDIDNWTCSCPAFLFSTYLMCKHLVQKYSIENSAFFPKFRFTIRRYNYPFIIFEKDNISQDNISQDNVLESSIEPGASSSHSAITERHAVIESRKAELASDSKTFEMLIKIINDNIENDKLYEAYKTLKQLLVGETNTCNEVLNSKKQQKTWKSRRNGKLAFWL